MILVEDGHRVIGTVVAVSAWLILIRHCEPDLDRQIPAGDWGLTDRGRQQARSLAATTWAAGLAAVACGDQQRMVESVQPLARSVGLPVLGHPAFRESRAEGWLPPEQFNDVVAGFFLEPAKEASPGWEPALDASQRFLSATRELLSRHDRGAVAVCSGGRVLTAVLDELGLVRRVDLFDTWRRIRVPDVAVVEFDRGHNAALRHSFGDGFRPSR